MGRATSGDGSATDTKPGEYVVGGLGGLLVVALLAFLAYQVVVVRETPPDVTAASRRSSRSPRATRSTSRRVNTGGRTAEEVEVSGSPSRESAQVEESSATISYVPPDSRRDGTLVFSENPGDGELTVAPSGYVLP